MAEGPRTLRDLRERLGLTVLQMADRAGCAVDVIVRIEMGIRIPTEESERENLALAYGLPAKEFLNLALQAADGWERSRSMRSGRA
ncbi:MAG: helix-turn-helix domain-containing protein [Candidatus Binatia bacterium]